MAGEFREHIFSGLLVAIQHLHSQRVVCSLLHRSKFIDLSIAIPFAPLEYASYFAKGDAEKEVKSDRLAKRDKCMKYIP